MINLAVPAALRMGLKVERVDVIGFVHVGGPPQLM
jgi:hypothetical protein